MYRGILIPVITPFHEDSSIDVETLRQLVDFYFSAKVQGLFALGSSGQGPALSESERRMVAEVIIDQAKDRVPVIIHVGCADTPTTVALAKHAHEIGASAIGVIPPYYYCDAPPSAVLEHYRKVAEACPLPIYIYENPKYCGISISPDFGTKLKEAVYNPDEGIYARIRELEREIVKNGEVRMAKAEDTIIGVKKLQWMVIGTTAATLVFDVELVDF